jgi:ABC-type transport system substrate-binding protein
MGFGGQGRTSLALSGQRPSSAAAGQDIADNHQQIKFNLRHGVQFHTGRELTAEDVKFSLLRIQDPKIASALTCGCMAVATSSKLVSRTSTS